MRSSHSLDRIDTAFDGTQLVADAGLLLPATLAQHLGLDDLVEAYLDLGKKPGAPNPGDKLMTLVMSALAGGDCIDDAAAPRAGGTHRILGFRGTFLRSFRWGHVRQLDAVSRHLLARAWGAGAGPGTAPFTIDLDSTICETYGLKKEGAVHHGYQGARLSPAPRRGSRYRRRPDGAPAGGTGGHRPGCPWGSETPNRDRITPIRSADVVAPLPRRPGPRPSPHQRWAWPRRRALERPRDPRPALSAPGAPPDGWPTQAPAHRPGLARGREPGYPA
jgi:hypothetical protein